MSDHRHRPSHDPDQPVWGQAETGPHAYGTGDQPVYGTHNEPVTYGHGSRRRRPPREPQYDQQHEPQYNQQQYNPQQYEQPPGYQAQQPPYPPGPYQQEPYPQQQGYPPAGYPQQQPYGQENYQGYEQEPYEEPAPRGRRRSAEQGPDPDFEQHRWGVGDRFDDDDDEEPRRLRWGRRKKADDGYDPLPATAAAAAVGSSIGSPPGPPPKPAARKGKGKGGGGLGALGWTSVVLTSLMVLGTLTAYTLFARTRSNIDFGKSTDELDKNRPENQTGAINVLLVGSDTRAGDNAKYGQKASREDTTERTDTIMLLHITPNRDGARLISFPRDSMVQIPECKDAKTGVIKPSHLAQINEAFNNGGMICTRRTIEDLTGIPVDHYIKVDFTGFKSIVDALGGINICVPQAVVDPKAKLNLKAGEQTVKGETALAYVRARYQLGDGSDIGRIERQQIFITQVVKKVTSSAILTDVGRLNAFIDAASKSVQMDDRLNTERLLEIALSARKLTAKGFKATTVPWEAYPGDTNRVQWKEPGAKNLFSSIITDTEVVPDKPAASANPSAPVDNTPKPTEAAQVRVQVINGTNTAGKAAEVANQLSAQGFKVTTLGNGVGADGLDRPTTTISYKGAGWEGSKLLAGVMMHEVKPDTKPIKGSAVNTFTAATPPPGADKKAIGPVIQLVIGKDFKGVKIPLSATEDASTVDADTDICQT
ncbi:LCP family protein [Acrocarpospora sp. B8E8]|uniref:LCP family protein n=1 Tax=Acrocarpospora sp. B8E8 TaxID=3153572 RepID=UPI00325F6BD4